MLLHDYFFYLSNQSFNETHSISMTMTHSPLFHSMSTLVLSTFGLGGNLICLILLCLIIARYHRRKQLSEQTNEFNKSIHVLSHRKYRFLVMLTSNDVLLGLSSIVSCLDEQFLSQSFIAHHHLCSLHILLWKFTLHFTPLLTIFILCRYIYISNRKFPMKFVNTTTLTQLLCTDLCVLIPFVIALAWSVDGLWLWGEINIRTIRASSISDNQTDEMSSTTVIEWNREQANRKWLDSNKQSTGKRLICYLQTNNNLQFTARLLHVIQADFVLLCCLHLLGFFLEIFLHIRLCCCLIAQKLTPAFLREQQLSLYILYIFFSLTLTSLPFYLYRTMEILFDLHIPSNYDDLVNNRALAQLILLGISCKPMLYFLLICPSKILFRFKCYTSIRIDPFDDILAMTQEQQKQPIMKKLSIERSQYRQSSLNLPTTHQKIRVNSRTLSQPILPTNDQSPSPTSIESHV